METQPPANDLTAATSTTLLDGLKDPANSLVWTHFVVRYQPPIVRCARRQGFNAEDAEDLAQRALLAFCKTYRAGKYKRERGRLRDWLFGITRLEIRQMRREQASPVEIMDILSEQAAEVAHECNFDALWEEEWRAAMLGAALREVRTHVDARTYEAFELFALRDLPARSVAERLGMTANAVFLAKKRILGQIRAALPGLEEGL